MILSLFFRVLRLLIISVICSLTIYFEIAEILADKSVLFLSFIVFVIETGIDTYRFSFVFWKMRDYFIGQLLPMVIYIVMGFLVCLTFRPVVFNRIFLPLRFAGCFGMSTIESIFVIGITFIVIVTILRFFGARSGFFLHNMYDVSKDED